MKLVCFDTETTGLDVQKDHIIQLSLVKVDTDSWEQIDSRDWYILPEGEFVIPAEAEAVHHISKSFLQENGVSLRSIYEELLAFTEGCEMLSYNGNGYDAPILYYNLKRIGKTFPFEGRTWYDALLLERQKMEGQVDPATGERYHCNLTATYTRYYGHPFEGAHNSFDDVLATIEVFKAQVAANGWQWAQRDDFGFISYDRWLVKRGNYYYLNQGGHKGESIESMLRIDRSYLEWIIDKCKWTDQQTKDIISPYLGGRSNSKKQSTPIAQNTQEKNAPLKSSDGKRRCKPTISGADLTLF
ncbi:MAG: 3'-5' exonuclease [Paludibacteraceae bacterium]|nr:3'-5' exonuclease [Paludibacteraceae bacterium]